VRKTKRVAAFSLEEANLMNDEPDDDVGDPTADPLGDHPAGYILDDIFSCAIDADGVMGDVLLGGDEKPPDDAKPDATSEEAKG
jgi:hypothetical protein